MNPEQSQSQTPSPKVSPSQTRNRQKIGNRALPNQTRNLAKDELLKNLVIYIWTVESAMSIEGVQTVQSGTTQASEGISGE